MLLIVEDDETDAQLLRSLCIESGYLEDIETATTIERAKEIARATPPTAFFVDLCLPDGNGFELVRWLRPQYAAPFAIVTSTLEAVNVARRLGAEFLAKPFHVEDVARVLGSFEPHGPALDRARIAYCLSDREFELARWIARGGTSDGFADHAGISRQIVAGTEERLLERTGDASVEAFVSRVVSGEMPNLGSRRSAPVPARRP
jgi:ActR/RegA family two-component response regulator